MPDDLYWKDIVGWSENQADRLRRLARGERVNDVDWEHVIEEVESVGRSEIRAARSLLRNALEHALKIHGWPDHPSARYWRGELRTFLADAREALDAGMVPRLDIAEVFGEARDRVLDLDLPPPSRDLPASLHLKGADLRDKAFRPDDLLARLTGP